MSAKNEEISSLVNEIITWIDCDRNEEGLEPVKIKPEDKLLQDEIFDSLKILQFISWLEVKYKINIGVKHMTPKFFESPLSIANNLHSLLRD